VPLIHPPHVKIYKQTVLLKVTKKSTCDFQISGWTENTWCAGQNPNSPREFLSPAMLVSSPLTWLTTSLPSDFLQLAATEGVLKRLFSLSGETT